MAIVDGKGKLTITGQLGDVMQESAHAAMSYVRSRAARLGLPKDFYRNVDIHIHVPEGAIPERRSIGRHYHGNSDCQRYEQDSRAS